MLNAEFTEEPPATLKVAEAETWRFQVSGGQTPYSVSIDWGDGKSSTNDNSDSHNFKATHTYSQKDIYIISFTVTDKNGISDTVETLQSVDAVQTLPEISVAATDAKASEDGDTGKFTLTRTGDLSVALTVNFAISGSATSGVDYKSLGSSAPLACC